MADLGIRLRGESALQGWGGEWSSLSRMCCKALENRPEERFNTSLCTRFKGPHHVRPLILKEGILRHKLDLQMHPVLRVLVCFVCSPNLSSPTLFGPRKPCLGPACKV